MIAEIRAALQTLLGNIAGVSGANAYPPETISTGIYAWVGFDDEVVTMGRNEIGLHTLPIYFVVNRNASLPKEVAATEPVIALIKTEIRGLPAGWVAGVDHVHFTRVQQAMINVGESPYVGVIVTLEIKTRENVAAEYGG